MIDTLGDRMKLYEGIEADRFLIPGIPVVVRLDGRSFHSFTKGLKRPYDERLSRMMIETTKYLVEESHASIGYTQSDEISLVYIPNGNDPINFFTGRVQKLSSVLASIATAKFNELKTELLPEKKKLATFDCRVWNVPNIIEAGNTLRWREWDATKNSISMAASAYYSHKQLQGLSGAKKIELLMEKGVNWKEYPPFFTRGTYVQRKTVELELSEDDLKTLPRKHNAIVSGNRKYIRGSVVELNLQPVNSISNFTDVIIGCDQIVNY